MKRILLLFLSILYLQGTQAQCPQRYLEEVFPAVKISKNINYGGRKINTDGTKTWLSLDLYEPKNDTAQLRPLVMLIHGGGFTNNPPLTRGTPDITELSKTLARKGYVVVSPEYRLFSGDATIDKMAETAVAGILDVNEAACYLVNSVESGNPFRIDTSRFFIGGSSAGALLSLYGSLINDTTDVPAPLRPAMRKVAEFDNIDVESTLQNKFCGMRPRVVVPISGALIDTTIIEQRDFSVLIVHGRKDKAVPVSEGYLLGNPGLPRVFGPDYTIGVLERAGFRVEADIYPDQFHVPVIWPFGDSLDYALQQLLLTGSAVNPPIMDSTQKHMSRMFFEALGSPVTVCNTPTGIGEHVYNGLLNISPNPTAGIVFIVDLPEAFYHNNVHVTVQNIAGQTIYDRFEQGNRSMTINLSAFEKGLYLLQLSVDTPGGPKVYVNKVLRQ